MDDWAAPRPLIVTNGQRLFIDENSAAILESVDVPMAVVVIAGIYRTGKSYLMNRLAKKRRGFPLGDTLQSKTKGIWAWYLRHPTRDGCALLLLDTEGLSDPEKGSDTNDMQLLSLSVLLSSLFVYNAIGCIDQEMINRLYFLTEVLNNITAKERNHEDRDEHGDYEELRDFLPDFALVVRDFTLDLTIGGETVTPDEYFQRVLQLRNGPRYNRFNRPRKAIQEAFRSHRCFVMSRPVQDEGLFRRLERVRDRDLSPRFVQQSNEFCHFVHSEAKLKTVNVGDESGLNGNVWMSLAREYVSAINRGAVPAIESTFANVAHRTNELAVNKSIEIYNYYVEQLVLPLSAEAANSAHHVGCKRARACFKIHGIGGDQWRYREELKKRLACACAEFHDQNQKKSREVSEARLDSLYRSKILPNIEGRSYLHEGGLYSYRADIRKLLARYDCMEGINGCMHEVVLDEFTEALEAEQNRIETAIEQLARREKRRIEQEKRTAELQRKEKAERKRVEAEKERQRQMKEELREKRREARKEYERKLRNARKRREEEEQIRLEESYSSSVQQDSSSESSDNEASNPIPCPIL